jgi:ABC-type transporter Mla maintaining outer membrane lipid asymmetry permease subunit MlaE
MMPLLTIYADFVGIMGGMLVGDLAARSLGFRSSWVACWQAVTLSDALLGVFKGLVFGASSASRAV